MVSYQPSRVIKNQPWQAWQAEQAKRGGNSRATIPRKGPYGKVLGAKSRGAAARNAVSIWQVPRSVRLPLVYEGFVAPPKDVTGIADPGQGVAVVSEVSAGCSVVRAMSIAPSSVGTPEPQAAASSSEKVECLRRIFDYRGFGFMSFRDLCTLFSVLAEKEWADRERFNEWCNLLGADPQQGLDATSFGRLLSLERTFIDDAFRLLGLETMPANRLAMPPGFLRAELIRSSLDSGRSFAARLARSWCCDFLRLLAAELAAGLGLSRIPTPAQAVPLAPEMVMEVLANLLLATHELIDATVAAVDRWHGCFQGYLRRGVLDACVEQWAAFDATWGAKIASLAAQVRGVEMLRQEVTDAGPLAKIDLVWRYIRSAASLLPVLESSRQHGLVVPARQLMNLEAVAKQVLRSGSPDGAEPVNTMTATEYVDSRTSSPLRPTGPRLRRPRDRRAAAYVQTSDKGFAKSSSVAPGGSHSVPASPVDMWRPGYKRISCEPSVPRKPSTAPTNVGRPGMHSRYARISGNSAEDSNFVGRSASALANPGDASTSVESITQVPIAFDAQQQCWFEQIHSEQSEHEPILGRENTFSVMDDGNDGRSAEVVECDGNNSPLVTEQHGDSVAHVDCNDDGSDAEIYDDDFCSEEEPSCKDRCSPVPCLSDQDSIFEAKPLNNSVVQDAAPVAAVNEYLSNVLFCASGTATGRVQAEKSDINPESEVQSNVAAFEEEIPRTYSSPSPGIDAASSKDAEEGDDDCDSVVDISRYRTQLYQESKEAEVTNSQRIEQGSSGPSGSGGESSQISDAQGNREGLGLFMAFLPAAEHALPLVPSAVSPRSVSSAEGSSVYDLDLEIEI